MSKLSKSQKFKIGVVTLFAFLAIGGSLTTLTACNTSTQKINPYNPNGDGRPGYEQVDPDSGNNDYDPYGNQDNNGGQVNPGDNNGGNEVNPGDNGNNNGGEVKPGDNNGNNGSEVKPGDEQGGEENPPYDAEEAAYRERVALENQIETTVAQKLNTKFGEELIDNVDIKYFTLEQDAKTLKTTFFAHGIVKFAGDTSIHEFSLGAPLDGDSFNKIAPIYYVDINQNQDLVANYSNDNLTLVNEFYADENLEFKSASLDGRTWDLNMLTPTQLEKQLEEDFEAKAKAFFKAKVNTEYLKNVDFKYISTEYDSSYGYMLKLNGETGNIYNDTIQNLCIKISISHADYDYLNEYVLTTPVNEANDLKDNYKSEQLNQVIDIINSDSSTVKFYEIDDTRYIVAQNNEQTL